MNEIEFERTARHAATSIRSEADRIAASDDALATLLANETSVADEPAPTIVPVDPVRAPRRRTPWLPILIAASTIAAVGGVVLLTTRDNDESIVVTTEPAQPDSTQPDEAEPAAIEPDTEQPDSTDADVTDPSVPTTRAADVVSDDEPFRPFSFDVPNEIGQPLPRTELYTAPIGSGEFDLGWEDCQECERLRPWGPVVDADGTIYIADVVNERWRVVSDGTSTNVPFPDGEVVAGSPLIGPDGLLYAPVAAELRHSSPRRVVAYDPASFREVTSYPVGPSIFDQLELINGELLLGGMVVTTFDVPLGTPTIDIDHEARLVTVSLSGTQREFHFPDEWLIDGRDAAPIDDGSVVVRALAGVDNDDREFVLVRLWLDGTTAAGVVNNDSTTNSAIQITSDGLVQLEGTTVVHYDLPTFAGPDPLADWVVPGFVEPDLAQVPLLLPQLSTSEDATSVRREGADQGAERISHQQTWVRSGDAGAVDAIVQITTRLDPQLIGNPADGGEVEVAEWPRAYFSMTSTDIDTLNLHSASRSMTVWTLGLDRAGVLAATTSLEVAGEGSGWNTPDLPDPERWTLVHGGWYAGAASRTVQQQPVDSSDYLEMWTVAGVPEAITTPGLFDSDVTLRSIDGRPALMFDRDGGANGVTWSPGDDVVVVLGSFGPIERLFEIAQSVVPVDQATWEAASTLDTSPGDGCNSIFC